LPKINRNSPCLCGSGDKYKNCCLKNEVKQENLSHNEWIKTLTLRGKNLYFLRIIADALQLDSFTNQRRTFNETMILLKSAITPEAVRNIHLAIPEIWPNEDDLNRCFTQEKHNNSGLFLGHYRIDTTIAFLNRHALYGQSFIMIDPFLDPRNTAPEYNPVDNPEQHINSTFHNILVYFQLLPWIEKGILKLIRDPGSFNYKLSQETMKASQLKSSIPELQKIIENTHVDENEDIKLFIQDQILFQPDEYILQDMKIKKEAEAEMKAYLKTRRENSFYCVSSKYTPQLMMFSTGTNYEMGKYICEKMNAYMITDIEYRWKEMEYDRKINGISLNSWSPFAKAFNEVDLKYLNGLNFDDILKLREDGYLNDMRSFIRRTWSSALSGDEFDKNRIEDLSAELTHHIHNAEHEWKKIDTNLVKWFGSESILGTTISIGMGIANWIPATAIAGAGIAHLLHNRMERKSFVNRYPAGFFIKKIRKNI